MVLRKDYSNTYKVLYCTQLWNGALFLTVLTTTAGVLQALSYLSVNSLNTIESKENITIEMIVGNFSELYKIPKDEVEELYKVYKAAREKERHDHLHHHHHAETYVEVLLNSVFMFCTIGWLLRLPSTVCAKIFAIVGGSVGIPITLLMINTGSHILIKLAIDTIRYLHHNQNYLVEGEIHMQNALKSIKARIIPTIMFIFIIYVLLTSTVRSLMHDMTYMDAIYLCIMTYTTIGETEILKFNVNGKLSTQFVCSIFTLFGVTIIVAFVNTLFIKTHWSLREYCQRETLRSVKRKTLGAVGRRQAMACQRAVFQFNYDFDIFQDIETELPVANSDTYDSKL